MQTDYCDLEMNILQGNEHTSGKPRKRTSGKCFRFERDINCNIPTHYFYRFIQITCIKKIHLGFKAQTTRDWYYFLSKSRSVYARNVILKCTKPILMKFLSTNSRVSISNNLLIYVYESIKKFRSTHTSKMYTYCIHNPLHLRSWLKRVLNIPVRK